MLTEANAGRKPRIPCVCKNCGKSFTKYPSRTASSRGRHHDICSRRCSILFLHRYRTERTDIEEAMAAILDGACIAFREQVDVCGWIVDFVIDDFNLIVFTDGLYWHTKPGAREKDAYQTERLSRQGWNVVRFSDARIKSSPSACLAMIESFRPYLGTA